MVNRISHNTSTIALASVVSAPSPLINYADRILLNEINRLEGQKQSMTFLKDAAIQNKTQLEQKTRQLEVLNNEITSLSKVADETNAKLQQFTEQRQLCLRALETILDKNSLSEQMTVLGNLTELVDKFSKEKKTCAEKITLAQSLKEKCEVDCDKLKKEFGGQTNEGMDREINEISLKILSIKNMLHKPVYPPQLSNFTPLPAIVRSSSHNNNNTNSSNVEPINLIHLSNTAVRLQNSLDQTTNASNQREINALPTQLSQSKESLSQAMKAMQNRLRAIIAAGESKSDMDISVILQEEGYNCSPSVVKYHRQILGLPNSNGKRSGEAQLAFRECLKKIIDEENPREPLTDRQIQEELSKLGHTKSRAIIGKQRAILGIPSYQERGGTREINQNSNSNSHSQINEPLDVSTNANLTEYEGLPTIEKAMSMQTYFRQLVNEEDPLNRLTDEQLGWLLTKAGYPCSANSAARYRRILNIPSVTQRYKSNSNTNNHGEQEEEDLNNTPPIAQRKSSKRKANPNLNENSIDLTGDEENSNSNSISLMLKPQNEKFPLRKKTSLQERLEEIITTSGPQRDKKLSLMLQKEGFECNQGKVKRNRQELGLPSSTDQKTSANTETIRDLLKEIIDNEDPENPFTDTELVVELEKEGYVLGRKKAYRERVILGYPSREERYKFYNSNGNSKTTATSALNASDSDSTDREVVVSGKNAHAKTKKYLQEIIDNEDPRKPLNDVELSRLLREKGFYCSDTSVWKLRKKLGIPNFKERHHNNNSSSSNSNSSNRNTQAMDLSND